MGYKEEVARSKIPRVPWKLILGQSLVAYLRDNKWKTNDMLVQDIMRKAREKIHILNMNGWSLLEVNKNLLISVSARRAEQKIYSNERR